jgi:hypothetical protein
MLSMPVLWTRSGEGVSARLRPALEGLADQLSRLSRHMDQVVFRDMWRAVAVAANRFMYNDIATEAQFSAEVCSLSADTFATCNSTAFTRAQDVQTLQQ